MLAFSPFYFAFVSSALALPQVRRSTTHTVQVGAGGQLQFHPTAISASIGDLVVFQFTSKNHSVIQSSFADPCAPLDKPGALNTGFHPVPDAATDFPTFNYTVTTASDVPLWFYCSQAGHTPNSHCFKGMVFAINCPKEGSNSFDNFHSKAVNDAAATLPPTPTSTNDIVPLLPDPTYIGITIPPPEPAVTLTDVITLGTSTWTTVYASYPNSPDPTPNSLGGSEIKVIVGGDEQLTFSPSRVTAKPRDRIIFSFMSKNHSVTQSSFAAPCSPFTSALGNSGIDSGFMFVPKGASSNFPTFTVTVNDTTPLWFYCSQPTHCGKGMVFSVNDDEAGDRNFSAFQKLAQQINGTSTSGGPYGSGGNGADRAGAASIAVLALSIAAGILL
jgi:plastocyanin